MSYRPELDGLRALAVIAVLLFHATPGGPMPGGFVGVDLFFVLSGFLITSILARGGSLMTFYWRRFLRLMPALLLMLATYLVFAPLVWPSQPHGRDAALTALYVSDYSYAFWQAPEYLRHTWSLSVEEHYYLIWPFVLPFLLRSRSPLLWLAGAWFVLTLWRLTFIGDWVSYYYRFDTRTTGLVVGSALYFLPRSLPAVAALAGFGILAVICAVGMIHAAALVIPLAEVGAALAVMGAASLGFLRTPFLVWLGKLSYGIYLWHFPIALALRDEHGFPFTVAIAGMASVVLAALSYYSVEAWARRLRDRIETGRRAQVGVLGCEPGRG